MRRFYVCTQAVLTMTEQGKSTGVVLDSGDGVTHTVPVFEWYTYPHAIMRQDFAGRDLTDFFSKSLRESDIKLTTSAEFDIARKMKNELCYVSMNFAEEVD